MGYLPKIYLKTLKNGTPIVASLTAAASGLLAYMATSANANKVFNWFVNLIAVGGLMIYVGIAWTYLRFRAACDAQGIDRSQFPFRSPFARAGAWICVIFLPSEPSRTCITGIWDLGYMLTGLVVAFFSAWQVFRDTKNFDTATFITSTFRPRSKLTQTTSPWYLFPAPISPASSGPRPRSSLLWR